VWALLVVFGQDYDSNPVEGHCFTIEFPSEIFLSSHFVTVYNDKPIIVVYEIDNLEFQ
jgi:hypothetical protein